MRKFEKVSFEQFKNDFAGIAGASNIEKIYDDLELPKRSTANSAGYDFRAPYNFELMPNEIVKIPTGIKVCMNNGEVLEILVRSSVGFKYNVRLCNQAGIVDSDYYNNNENEGHIWLAFQNHGKEKWIVKKGDRIVQGLFIKFLTVDDESAIKEKRTGGIGSTNNKRSDNNE
jgi:dUTP pyrophosphatase